MASQQCSVTTADEGDDSDVEVCHVGRDSPREQWLGEHVLEEVAFVYREETEARPCEGMMNDVVMAVDVTEREEVDSGQDEGLVWQWKMSVLRWMRTLMMEMEE
jgi:hypothetical protein